MRQVHLLGSLVMLLLTATGTAFLHQLLALEMMLLLLKVVMTICGCDGQTATANKTPILLLLHCRVP